MQEKKEKKKKKLWSAHMKEKELNEQNASTGNEEEARDGRKVMEPKSK